MSAHSRTTLAAIVVICAAITSTGRAAQQSPPQGAVRIAYDLCYVDFNEERIRCAIRVWVDGSDTWVAWGTQPKWSPDGTRIVFVDIDTWEIAVVSVADAGVITYLPSFNGGAPAWSADGQKIAYVSEDGTGSGELYLVNADGTNTVRLTNGIGFTGDFAWSPDGSTIALAREVGGVRDLYKMNADGSNLVRLTSTAGFTGGFTWSPGGTRLTFDCGNEVCAINADGTGLEQLTMGSGFGGVFSPTEDRLAFATGNQIVLKLASGQILPLAPGTPGHTPEWSPGGNSLIFQGTEILWSSGDCNWYPWVCVDMTGLYMVNADASDLRLVALGTNPDWFTPRPGQPVASFTDQCDGVSCVFDGGGSIDPNGAIVNYSWQFGDGTTGTGAAPSHTYLTGGQYVVTLTITDQEGLTSTTSRRVAANTGPVASFTVACNGPTCTVDASASSDPDGTISDYNWNFGDGQGGWGSVVTHTFPTGTFLIRLSVRDNAGALAQATATVQAVNAPPTASFTALCPGFVCTFDASASSGMDDTIREYFWQFGDAHGEYGGPIKTHRYAAVGTYAVTLKVTDAASQQATVSRTIVVAPPPMHVGDLDGSRTLAAPGLWKANATITVHDADHRPVAGAYVTVRWSTGETYSCSTDASGRSCVFNAYMPKKTGSMLLTVLAVTHDGFVYVPGANHDPDGDSDGTTIRIPR